MTFSTKAIAAALLLSLAPAVSGAQTIGHTGPGSFPINIGAPVINPGYGPGAQPAPIQPVQGQDCGASHFQYLVGLHPSIYPLPAHAEVVHPGTIRTTQYIETRLNVAIGQNGHVERVYCG